MLLNSRKILIFVTVVVYFLTPYSLKTVSVTCECGCRELICYCCINVQDFRDVTSYSKCRCPVSDESYYTQPPTIVSDLFEIRDILDGAGNVLSNDNDSALPGYVKPLLKPPPIAS
jgi:hypothetical protein